jgi:hypothetical protein
MRLLAVVNARLADEDDLFGRVGIEVEFLNTIIVIVLLILQGAVLSA